MNEKLKECKECTVHRTGKESETKFKKLKMLMMGKKTFEETIRGYIEPSEAL